MKVLLVDDDQLDRMATKRLLKKSLNDINIVESDTGKNAVEMIKANQFDLILLDYNLPDINGLDILIEINTDSLGNAAVLFLSGEENEVLAKRCLEHGAQDFLQKKHLTSNHLIKAITHAKLRHKNEHELEVNRQKMQQLAEHDQLTGLLNRYAFETRVADKNGFGRRTVDSRSLMLLDLDNFKWINDTFGHDAGDHILKTVAQRLQHVCRENDLICRLGGDEFAIAIACKDADYSSSVADRIFKRLKPPIPIGSIDITIECSIGIADLPEETVNLHEALKQADLAMYKAKAEGRNRFHYFSESLQSIAIRRMSVHSDLRTAIKREEFVVFYQPQFDSHGKSIIGIEALVRWQHPSKGLLNPADFLDIAEETGLIVEIDKLVISAASKQYAQWKSQLPSFDNIKMAINISARQFKDEGFLPTIQTTLEEFSLDPSNIELEIVESELVQDFTIALSVINRLNDLGIAVAIDDFGTGYSSLSYLKRLNVQTLKVDRSFLEDVPTSEVSCRLLRGLINLGKSMELKIVVEGVETQEHLNKCIEYDADVSQGYFFAKPMIASDIEKFF
ncbi:two-component system response regulator [Aliiglaciecola litoralis]|uniref:GGDEF domain-containing response regulator n=1 Tax=Aliiglaciecola litoralis TaxID=582857 RepID=A0ABN1LEM2_9ALTE